MFTIIANSELVYVMRKAHDLPVEMIRYPAEAHVMVAHGGPTGGATVSSGVRRIVTGVGRTADAGLQRPREPASSRDRGQGIGLYRWVGRTRHYIFRIGVRRQA